MDRKVNPTPVTILRLSLFLLSLLTVVSPVRAHNRADAPIEYQLSIASLSKRLLHVRIIVRDVATPRVRFAIPAWTPGYYQILNYEKNIENVNAQDADGKPLPLSHPDARSWETAAPEENATPNTVTIAYDVHANDEGLGFFGAVLQEKERQGYVNGASTLMYVAGETQRPTTLTLALPKDWKLATPLVRENRTVPKGDKALPMEDFSAKNYDELIDCPLQFGQFAQIDFSVENIPYSCVLVGKTQTDRQALIQNITKIIQAAVRVTGIVPYPRYIFFYHCGGGGFSGGLEHRSSTVIHLAEAVRDGADDEFLAVTAHEFFHAWNVKYLHPAALGPFDYTQAIRTDALWFAEGVTDYYADLLLVRAGLRSSSWFLKEFAARIAELDATPSRKRISLARASQGAWEGESMGFDGLSYYLKGSLLGFYFDLRLRALTDGKRCLDNVMRALIADYAQKSIGYPPNAIADALDNIAGASLHEEYDHYVKGTEEIAWEPALLAVGLELKREPHAFLGLQLDEEQTRQNRVRSVFARVKGVEVGFAAEAIGLQPKDDILRVNGHPTTTETFTEMVRALKPNSPITFVVQRHEETIDLSGMTGTVYTKHRLLPASESQLSPLARSIRAALFKVIVPTSPLQNTRKTDRIDFARMVSLSSPSGSARLFEP